ncbi:MAG: hypothetical protein ACLUKN_14720 [Bacilli bacterium]
MECPQTPNSVIAALLIRAEMRYGKIMGRVFDTYCCNARNDAEHSKIGWLTYKTT